MRKINMVSSSRSQKCSGAVSGTSQALAQTHLYVNNFFKILLNENTKWYKLCDRVLLDFKWASSRKQKLSWELCIILSSQMCCVRKEYLRQMKEYVSMFSDDRNHIYLKETLKIHKRVEREWYG